MNIEDVFRKLRPIMGAQLDALWREYIVADSQSRQIIEQTLRIKLAQRLKETYESQDVLLKPPPRGTAEGDYHVGTVYYGKKVLHPFGLREDELIQHDPDLFVCGELPARGPLDLTDDILSFGHNFSSFPG